MDTKTAIILHALGVALIALGVSYKWTIEGFIFLAAGGALCAACLESLINSKPKRKKDEP